MTFNNNNNEDRGDHNVALEITIDDNEHDEYGDRGDGEFPKKDGVGQSGLGRSTWLWYKGIIDYFLTLNFKAKANGST